MPHRTDQAHEPAALRIRSWVSQVARYDRFATDRMLRDLAMLDFDGELPAVTAQLPMPVDAVIMSIDR